MKSLLSINWPSFLRGLGWYLQDLTKFRSKDGNKYAIANLGDLRPYLNDRTAKTSIEPIYFLQDIWLAEKVFERKPAHHIDIGSSVKTIAIISKLIPTTFVDIRPPEIMINRLKYLKGSVLNLPFRSSSQKSVSSVCVLEHIGLGRYGDPIDPKGSEKAIKEVKRIVARGGDLYVTVPVHSSNKTFFNAQRTFTRDYFLSLFIPDFYLKEEKYIYGKAFLSKYDRKKGFGTGLYYFQKK